MSPFDPSMLSGALDEAAFDVIDELMDYFAPEPPFLTFGSPGAARVLSVYGRTVLASRDFSDPFNGVQEQGIETRVAGPEDPMVFPPRRFGFVHARWTSLAGGTVGNLTRWLKHGGVLLVEAPDDYPARNLPRGPYQNVAEALADRMEIPSTAPLPGLLMRHGLTSVGCRHRLPVARAFQAVFQRLIEQTHPWHPAMEADLRDWPHDPVAMTPALTNVMVWGIKTSQ